jgi:nickel transport protein
MREKGLLRKQSRPNLWVQGVFLTLIICLLATPALAHRVLVFAVLEGDTIKTEAKFVPNTPVRQGKVQVLEAKTDKVVATGQTDDQGKASIKVPPEALKENLKVVVEASMGHRGEFLLKAR